MPLEPVLISLIESAATIKWADQSHVISFTAGKNEAGGSVKVPRPGLREQRSANTRSTQEQATPRGKIINHDRESLMEVVKTLHRTSGESEKKTKSP